MKIRKPEQKDAESIVDLVVQLGYPDMSLEAVAEKIRSHNEDGYSMLVCETNGKVSGFISMHWFDMAHLSEKYGRITSFCVDASQRSKGIGKALLSAAEDLLFSRGCMRIELTSNIHRDQAHHFYLAQGYEEKPKRFVKQKPK